MLDKAKKLDNIFYFKREDDRMKTFGAEDMWPGWRQFFLFLQPFIPNVEFVVNIKDEPRVLKNNCKLD